MRNISILIVFILFGCIGLFAQHFDTVPTSYPLSDPRNPNCPCHKIQQLADDEYKKFQSQNSTNIPQQKVLQRDNVDQATNKKLNDDHNTNQNELSNSNTNHTQALRQIILEDNNDQIFVESDSQNNGMVKRNYSSQKKSVTTGKSVQRKRSTIKKFICKRGRKLERMFHKRKNKTYQVENCFSWKV